MDSKVNTGVTSRQTVQTVLLYFTTMFGILLGVLSSVINTRFLPPEDYGNVRYVENIINYIAAFLFWGHFYAGSRMLAVSGSKERSSSIRGALVVMLSLASVILVVATSICGVFHKGVLARLFFISLPVCLQPLLLNYVNNVLPGDSHIFRVSLTRFLPAMLYVPLAYFIYSSYGATSSSMILLQWGVAVLVFLGVIVTTRPSFSGIGPIFPQLKKENGEYGRELFIGALIAVASNYIAGITLGIFNDDNASVGFYTLALTVTYPLSTLPAIVGTSFFKAFATQERISYKVMYVTTILTIVSCILFILFINPVVTFLYSEQYRQVGVIAQWMSVSFCIHGLGDIYSRFLAAHGQGWQVRNTSIISGVIKILGFIFLVWVWNVDGALTTLFLSELAYFITLFVYYRRYVNGDKSDGSAPKALIAVNHIGFMHFIFKDIDILRELGFDVHVAADNAAGEDDTVTILMEHGASRLHDVRLDRNRTLTVNNIRCFFSYRKLISNGAYSLVICHTPIIGFIVRIASAGMRRRGLKVIYFSHGMMYNSYSRGIPRYVYAAGEHFASRFCDAIICINEEDKERFSRMRCSSVFKVPGVGVRPLSIPVDFDRKKYRIALGLDSDKVVVLSIGRISPEKNQKTVVRAMGSLKRKDDYVLVICGGGLETETASEIRECASAEGVDVRFLGHRADIPQIVGCSDFGVLPSVREGMGMAGLEMLSGGIPVVGTAVQGIREYCVNGVTGFLVDGPGDIDGLVRAMDALYDPAVRASMRDACVSMADAFSSERSEAERLRIYDYVINGDLSIGHGNISYKR